MTRRASSPRLTPTSALTPSWRPSSGPQDIGYIASSAALPLAPPTAPAWLAASSPAGGGGGVLGRWWGGRGGRRGDPGPLGGAVLWWGWAAPAVPGASAVALLWVGLGFLLAQALPGFALARRLERSARV